MKTLHAKATTQTKGALSLINVNTGMITLKASYSVAIKHVFEAFNNELKSNKGHLQSAKEVLLSIDTLTAEDIKTIHTAIKQQKAYLSDNGLEGSSSFNRWLSFYNTMHKNFKTIVMDVKELNDIEAMKQKEVIDFVMLYSDNGNKGKAKATTATGAKSVPTEGQKVTIEQPTKEISKSNDLDKFASASKEELVNMLVMLSKNPLLDATDSKALMTVANHVKTA